MIEVMSVERWKKYTDGGTFSRRSAELRAIDTALALYHKTGKAEDLEVLRAALANWMMAKGSTWKSSVRNRYHAVDDLFRQISNFGNPQLSAAELVGLSHVRAESNALLDKLFLDQQLVWRPTFAAKLANAKWGVRLNTAGAARNVAILTPSIGVSVPKPGMPGAPGSRSRAAAAFAADIFKALVPSELSIDVSAELAKIIPGFMTQLAASLTPFVGVIMAGGSAVKGGLTVARDEYRVYWATVHQERSLSKETPEKAIQSMIQVMWREQRSHEIDASVALGEFAGKLGGLLVDGGTATNAAIGLSANVLKLTNIIRVVVRDVQERNAANKLMKKPLQIDVFETCPVLGAYYVCCAPTSALVNEVLERFNHHGWRGDVERTVKHHIEPLKVQGRRLIKEHRFVIPELQNMPGMMEVNTKALKEMQKRKGKTGMVGFGPDSMPPLPGA